MNKLKISFTILIVIIISSFIYTKFTKNNLNLISLNGKALNENNLKKNNILFIYFSLGCGECEELLIKVREKEEVLNRKHQIVYVSNEKDKRKIIEFIRNKNINIDTSKVYIDQRDSFENFFNLDFVVNFPTICLYNANNNTKTIIKEIDNLY
jgi:hypothetical protein